MASYYVFVCENCSKDVSQEDEDEIISLPSLRSQAGKKRSFLIGTSGPHEFKDNGSHIETLPHPGSYLADGLYLNVYCTKCMENQKVIIVRFKKPSNPFYALKSNICEQYLNNYSGYIGKYPALNAISTECFNYNAIKCPKCNSPHIIDMDDGGKKGIVLYKPFKNITYLCPECGTGNLTGRRTCIS